MKQNWQDTQLAICRHTCHPQPKFARVPGTWCSVVNYGHLGSWLRCHHPVNLNLFHACFWNLEILPTFFPDGFGKNSNVLYKIIGRSKFTAQIHWTSGISFFFKKWYLSQKGTQWAGPDKRSLSFWPELHKLKMEKLWSWG